MLSATMIGHRYLEQGCGLFGVILCGQNFLFSVELAAIPIEKHKSQIKVHLR